MPDEIVKTTPRTQRIDRSFTAYYGWDDEDVSTRMSWNDSMTGHKNPSYRKIIEAGSNATTVLDGFKMRINYRPGYAESRYHSIPEYWYKQRGITLADATIIPEALPFSSLAEVNSVAVGKFVARCVEAQQSFSGSQFLAELRETIHQLRSPVKTLLHNLKRTVAYAMKHKKFKSYGRKQKWISDTWLEWSFGAKPTMSDIHNLMETLHRYDPNPSKHVRSGHKLETSDHKTYTGTYRFTADFDEVNKYRCSVRYQGVVWLRPPYLSPSQKWLSDYGFDPIRDFVPTIHEIIPWSFFVDYFSNIAEIVQAYCFWSGNLRWYCRTYELVSHKSITGSPYRRSGHTFVVNQPESITSYSRVVRRDVPPTLVPDLVLEVPGADKWSRWCNIAALLNGFR